MLSKEGRKAKERKLDAAAVKWKNSSTENRQVYKNEIWLLVFELYEQGDQGDICGYDPNAFLDALEEAFNKYRPEAGQFSHYFSLLFSGRKKDAFHKKQRHAPDGESLAKPVSEDGELTLEDILPASKNTEPENIMDTDVLLGDLTALILNFSKRKGKENNPSRLVWYRQFYTEDMTLAMKVRPIYFLHERDIFSAMDVEYLDYYMATPCRTGQAVKNTPLKPYCQVVPTRKEVCPVPVPIPKEVVVCYRRHKKMSGGAPARGTQHGHYMEDKEQLLFR